MPAPQLRAFTTANLSGDAVLSEDTLSLSDLQLGLDAMSFEGALAVHARDGRPGLAGTLATDRIALDPFLSSLPALRRVDGTWNDAPLDAHLVADDDIDLRISASHATVGGLRFDDGSLSLQSGNGRMELSIGEARAYDGLLKGRVVAITAGETTDVHADLSVSRLDLTKLTRNLTHASALAGTATGHVTLGGRGPSPAAIIDSLDDAVRSVFATVRWGRVSPDR